MKYPTIQYFIDLQVIRFMQHMNIQYVFISNFDRYKVQY